ncbi:hypothetical protein BGZ96_006674 [Linnemannia gamsii]|uniref:Uncharacterized protein n=1 Tax=Linnemannia gamsii TaxID=64522 RepID=A0ABQ7K330_9FUNG|nr:hypothetical protein BGZ96_006674 [Linnemannia gamsii]
MNACKVENVYLDQTRKVMVGGIKWCVLTTLAVMVTDGTVVIGPDNKVFYLKATSQVWIKKMSFGLSNTTRSLHNTMTRQLRSEFNDEATFEPYSAVHSLFIIESPNHYASDPEDTL